MVTISSNYRPEAATEIIGIFGKISDPSVIAAGFDFIDSLLHDPVYNKVDQFDAFLCKILANVAQNQTPFTRQKALHELAIASTTLVSRFHVSLSACFSAEDQTDLRKVLDVEAIPWAELQGYLRSDGPARFLPDFVGE